MPVLANPQHEKFVQALVDGMTQANAVKAAGYTDNDGAASRGSQIWARPEIKQRYRELLDERKATKAEQKVTESAPAPGGITVDWMINELKQNITDARTAGKPGDVNKSLAMIGELMGFFKQPPPQDPNNGNGAPTESKFPNFDPQKLREAPDVLESTLVDEEDDA